MEVLQPKLVNSILNIIEVNSLRLGDFQMNIYLPNKKIKTNSKKVWYNKFWLTLWTKNKLTKV